jgi:hypothetical protein
MPGVPAQLANVDQQYASVKQVLDRMVSGLRRELGCEYDEAAGWLGTVQASLKCAKTDPEYLDSLVQLATAAFIRLAKEN